MATLLGGGLVLASVPLPWLSGASHFREGFDILGYELGVPGAVLAVLGLSMVAYGITAFFVPMGYLQAAFAISVSIAVGALGVYTILNVEHIVKDLRPGGLASSFWGPDIGVYLALAGAVLGWIGGIGFLVVVIATGKPKQGLSSS